MCLRNSKTAEMLDDSDKDHRDVTKGVIGLGLAHLIIQVSTISLFSIEYYNNKILFVFRVSAQAKWLMAVHEYS